MLFSFDGAAAIIPPDGMRHYCLRFTTAPAHRPSDIHQDAVARFRETIFWARSMKARKLAAMWRRPG